jgi:diguanylate cyclase (GGDEF)-like protein
MNKILLLIRNGPSRQAIESALSKAYEIVPEDAETPLQGDFDLAIIDGPTLKRMGRKIRARREAEESVFLPFLLLTVRRKGSIPVRTLGKLVDDVIVKPIHRDELRARIANLLHRRELSLGLKKEHDLVARLSVTDDVTCFHNTRYLHRYLDKFFASPKIRGKRLCLVFFDIDNFKEVVDRHGHLAARKILREVAQAIDRVIDSDDRIVRYGGDEFVVVLPGQNKEQGTAKVERMLDAISQTAFLTKENLDVHVTASFGLACYPDDARSEEDLLAIADDCLFQSKRSGKNKVTLNK